MWFYKVDIKNINSVPLFLAGDDLYMSERNFRALGRSTEGREKIFVHQNAQRFYLSELQVDLIKSFFPERNLKDEDINLFTQKELYDLLH